MKRIQETSKTIIADETDSQAELKKAFKRLEFDRHARFHSWGSARETFDWPDMCNVKRPISPLEVQKSIVAIHHTLETRKRLNNDLKKQIENLCTILM